MFSTCSSGSCLCDTNSTALDESRGGEMQYCDEFVSPGGHILGSSVLD